MRITSLSAKGWRNLTGLAIAFDPTARLHVFSGDNGQGKTNVLEALYYLAAFRSFRTSRASDLVQRGTREARVEVRLEARELTHDLGVTLSLATSAPSPPSPPTDGSISRAVAGDGGAVRTARGSAGERVSRRIDVDGKGIRGVAGAFGKLSVVLFVPEDLLLVRAAPAARRHFVDMAIAQTEPAYFREAATFQKILSSRNSVLRDPRAAGATAWLDTYDEQLAKAGARIIARRRAVVAAVAPRAAELFQQLHANLAVGISYVSAPSVNEAALVPEIEAALLGGLRGRRQLDERRGHTTFGPQTDDLEIRLDGRPAREHASQGQLRSLVLALKLAELHQIEATRGETPILLLDDVPSELDPTRRGYLFRTLAQLPGQTMVSVADPAVVPPAPTRVDFKVASGRVQRA